jgi:trk system potassium uptake protein TrkA
MQAHHDTVVETDDHIILFITDRRHTDEVERLFQEAVKFR